MRPTDKWTCKECDWRGLESELLLAPNPFQINDEICGCPKCKSVDCFAAACDEPECWREVSCGTPTPSGYRSTCGKHRPDSSMNKGSE